MVSRTIPFALLLVACTTPVDEQPPAPTVNPDCHELTGDACEDRAPWWVGPEPACGERAEFVWGCYLDADGCTRGPSSWVTPRCDGSVAHQPCETLTTREDCERRATGYAGEQPACGEPGWFYPAASACVWWDGRACIDAGLVEQTYVCAGAGDG